MLARMPQTLTRVVKQLWWSPKSIPLWKIENHKPDKIINLIFFKVADQLLSLVPGTSNSWSFPASGIFIPENNTWVADLGGGRSPSGSSFWPLNRAIHQTLGIRKPWPYPKDGFFSLYVSCFSWVFVRWEKAAPCSHRLLSRRQQDAKQAAACHAVDCENTVLRIQGAMFF